MRGGFAIGRGLFQHPGLQSALARTGVGRERCEDLRSEDEMPNANLIVVVEVGAQDQASAIEKGAVDAFEIGEAHFEFGDDDFTMMAADDFAGELQVAIRPASKLEERSV